MHKPTLPGQLKAELSNGFVLAVFRFRQRVTRFRDNPDCFNPISTRRWHEERSHVECPLSTFFARYDCALSTYKTSQAREESWICANCVKRG